MHSNAGGLRSKREELLRTLTAPAFRFPRCKFRDKVISQMEWYLVWADALLSKLSSVIAVIRGREPRNGNLLRLATNQADACFHSIDSKTSHLHFTYKCWWVLGSKLSETPSSLPQGL